MFEIKAGARRRLVDEHDAAQARGEVAPRHRTEEFGVADDNAKPSGGIAGSDIPAIPAVTRVGRTAHPEPFSAETLLARQGSFSVSG
ncbi:MAG: hypothetical protein JJU40_08370 [Rhodobacteraceae bacterium]|nr:hypothetical protein [Paracoccaceae bacterium]